MRKTIETRGKRRPKSRWVWDRATICLFLLALLLIALVVFEVVRSRRPLRP